MPMCWMEKERRDHFAGCLLLHSGGRSDSSPKSTDAQYSKGTCLDRRGQQKICPGVWAEKNGYITKPEQYNGVEKSGTDIWNVVQQMSGAVSGQNMYERSGYAVKAAAEIRSLQERFMLQKVETGITISPPGRRKIVRCW